ncbi:MAG: alpha-mannosidase [Trueperaceae bacterium]
MNGRDPLSQRLDALAKRIEEIGAWRDHDVRPIGGVHVRVDGRARPIAPGEPWPVRDLPTVFEVQAQAPDAWPGRPLELHVDVGGEALVLVDGVARLGSNPFHRRLRLREAGGDARRWSLRIEAVPYAQFGRRLDAPKLQRLDWVLPDDEARAFHDDLTAAHDAAGALMRHGRRALSQRLADLLRETLAGLRVPRTPTDAYLARVGPSFATDATGSEGGLAAVWEGWRFDAAPLPLDDASRQAWRVARRRLAERLAELREASPGEGAFVAVGHAHLDLAWLWPLAETRRKARRTFATVLDAMDRDPDHRFAQSMAQLYADLERDDPELFARIRARVAEGRWEVVGGMWVEPDGNLPSGEAWARQLLLGQRWLASRFGRLSTVGWLPDTFGYAANLPQLLRQAGITGFFTTKLEWNDRDRFPHDLYRWEGIDGSRVLAHQLRNPSGGYNGLVEAEGLLASWENFDGKRWHDASLYVFGHGDGGGGPDDAMRARLPRLAAFPGLPRVRPGRVDAFFRGADREGLPVWRGEQYLELHRGTYTTQSRLKRLNRRLEHVLVEAEAAATLDGAGGDADADGRTQRLRELWTVLLRNQFHDVLPGSSVRTVNLEAEAELSDALDRASRLRQAALERLSARIETELVGSGRLVVWNLALEDRPLRAVLPRPHDGPFTLLDPGGRTVTWQAVEGGLVVDDPELVVPGLGHLALDVRIGPAEADEPGAAPGRPAEASDARLGGTLAATAQRLANDVLDVRVAADGTLASLIDRRNGEELLAGPANRIAAHTDLPRFFEAWEIDPDDAEAAVDLAADAPPELIEDGPVRAAIRVRRSTDGVSVEQELRLTRHGDRLDVVTRIDVHGRRTQLRVVMPLAVRSDHATYETAFGAVTRPTHRNTSWDAARFEVPGHRWADLSDGARGVSLLNDGRYGHAAHGGTLSLTLVRSPIFPDPWADEGEHEVVYALRPHQGDWRHGTVAAAHDLNAPLLGVVVRPAGDAGAEPGRRARLPSRHAHLRILGGGMRLAALKPAEEGAGVVLRLYDAHGAAGRARIEALPDGWSLAGRVDLLERPIAGDVDAEEDEATIVHGPYQVVSLALGRD